MDILQNLVFTFAVLKFFELSHVLDDYLVFLEEFFTCLQFFWYLKGIIKLILIKLFDRCLQIILKNLLPTLVIKNTHLNHMIVIVQNIPVNLILISHIRFIKLFIELRIFLDYKISFWSFPLNFMPFKIFAPPIKLILLNYLIHLILKFRLFRCLILKA